MDLRRFQKDVNGATLEPTGNSGVAMAAVCSGFFSESLEYGHIWQTRTKVGFSTYSTSESDSRSTGLP